MFPSFTFSPANFFTPNRFPATFPEIVTLPAATICDRFKKSKLKNLLLSKYKNVPDDDTIISLPFQVPTMFSVL